MRPGSLLTTVVTPADDTDLTTLAAVKDELKIKDTFEDSWLNTRISSASTTIQTYCNRIFALQTIQDQFWFTRDSWPQVARDEIAPLQLSNWPLISVTSAVATIAGVATTLIEGTDFLSKLPQGQLIRLDARGNPRFWRESPITAIYQAGYADIPGDVAEAAILLVKMRWFARRRDPNVRSQSAAGLYEASYVMGTGPGGADDMPAEVTAKIDRYRMDVFA